MHEVSVLSPSPHVNRYLVVGLGTGIPTTIGVEMVLRNEEYLSLKQYFSNIRRQNPANNTLPSNKIISKLSQIVID